MQYLSNGHLVSMLCKKDTKKLPLAMGLSVTLALHGLGLTCMKRLTYTGAHQTAPPKLHISHYHLTLTGIHFNMTLVLWIDEQASFHGFGWTSFICLALHLGNCFLQRAT